MENQAIQPGPVGGGARQPSLLIFAVLSIALLAAGWFFYGRQREYYRQQLEARLTSIASLKIAEIDQWRKGWIWDATVLAQNPLVAQRVAEFVDRNQPAERAPELAQWLKTIQSAYDCLDVLLADTNGLARLATGTTTAHFGDYARSRLLEAVGTGQPAVTDLHRQSEDLPIHLDVLSPISFEGRCVAVLLIRVDPRRFLFPLIRIWPTPSRSAESLLVEEDGQDVVFLNELRHQTGTAMRLRFPLDAVRIPAVKAVLGTTGVVQGVDYRHIPVIAAVYPVPDTPWFLVTKIDSDEAFAPLRRQALLVAGVVALLILVIGLSLSYIEQRQHAEVLRRTLEAERERDVMVERFQNLARYANDVVLLIEESGRIVEANERAAETYGRSRDELVGLNVRDLVPESEWAGVPARLRKIADEGGLHFESAHLRKDGSVLAADVSARSIPVDGRVYFQCIIRDITERKKAEEALQLSEARLRLSQEAAKAGSWEWDLRTQANYWSDELWKLYDLEPHSVQPAYDSWRSTVRPEDLPGVERTVSESVRQGLELNFEWRVRTRDGSERWLMSRGQPMRDAHGRVILYRGIVMDITERKRAEEEIRKLNEFLELRVWERTAQLEATVKELEAFAYSVSHDLRGPLRSISGFSQMLLQESGGKLDERERQDLERITSAAFKMSQLIDNMLSLSRLTRKEMKIEPVDLGRIAREIGAELQSANPERSVELVITEPAPAMGDEHLLRVALQNLLANAWKFTRNVPDARIEFGSRWTEGIRVFFVRDNGAGFDMRYKDKLFGAFQRLHTDSEFEGQGIGLATVKRIVQRHNGRVWAEGAVGRGATFHFVLGDEPAAGGRSGA